MRLPNCDLATVDEAKVRDYLLSPSHPVGRFKSVFFVKLGFSVDEWEGLRDTLLQVVEEPLPDKDASHDAKLVRRVVPVRRDHREKEIVPESPCSKPCRQEDVPDTSACRDLVDVGVRTDMHDTVQNRVVDLRSMSPF